MKKTLTYTRTNRWRDGLTLDELAAFVEDARAIGSHDYREPVVTVKPIREGGKTGCIVKLETTVTT